MSPKLIQLWTTKCVSTGYLHQCELTSGKNSRLQNNTRCWSHASFVCRAAYQQGEMHEGQPFPGKTQKLVKTPRLLISRSCTLDLECWGSWCWVFVRCQLTSGVTKWPDTQNQEARDEGLKPLPRVRQVWWQATWPSYFMPSHFNSHLK